MYLLYVLLLELFYILLEFLGDSAVKAVAVGNCYIC
jgi:hypothetical protein